MAGRARAVRMLTWGLGGVAVGVLIVLLLLNIVARTQRGHDFVLTRTLAALGKNVQGDLAIERIDGNLFEGAKLYGLRLTDKQGRAFLVADSAFLDYRVTTLLTPRIHITRATLYDPEVYVFKLPGDSLWNYQAIFARGTPRDTTRPQVERATRVDTLRMINGTVRLQTPWAPDSTLPARQRRALIADALSDTSLALIDSVPGGGYIRTMNFTRLNGRLTRVRFAPGTRAGSRIHLDSLRGTAQIFRDTVQIRQLQAQVALLRGHVELDVPVIALPGSRLALFGVVRTDSFPTWFDRDKAPMYDLSFTTDSVAFRDLQWLYPRFPAEARGKLSLRIEHRPEGLMFLGRELDLRARGTHLVGDFGMILGDTLRFVDVDVEAEPISTATLERMLPQGLSVQGLVLGGVQIQGAPAGSRRTRAEAEAEDEIEEAEAREAGEAAAEPGSATEAARVEKGEP